MPREGVKSYETPGRQEGKQRKKGFVVLVDGFPLKHPLRGLIFFSIPFLFGKNGVEMKLTFLGILHYICGKSKGISDLEWIFLNLH
jgi:hypothetical protein